MKIIVTKEQLDIIRENDSKDFNCDKCEHSWKIEPKDKFPYLCHMCGYDSHKKKHNYKELENFWKNYKKEEEQITESEEKEDKLKRNGYDIEGIKTAIKVMSQLSETYGEGIPLDFSLHDYYLKQNEGNRRPILQLFIDIDKKDGEEYKITQMYRHEISVELLNVFEMMGLYEDERMSPYYNFHFNKRNLE